MSKKNRKPNHDNHIDNNDPNYLKEFDLDPVDQLLQHINIHTKCKTENQKKLVKLIREKEVTICSGLAGTGKTFLSCSEALRLIKNYKKYQKIVIVKSVTTLKNEEIGFLKGDMKEKMEPFMYSFIHNFEKLIGPTLVSQLQSHNIIQALPIAYMRGINLDNSIIIIDEAQNISVENIRTILTRLGTDSKMIFLGDEYQIDMKDKSSSSLRFLMDKFQEIDEIGILRLLEEDVVRNPLIRKIEKIFMNLPK
jgi:phosphate starvation-inducible PhoH-like protein